MNGLLAALRVSTSESLRGVQRWTELFFPFPRGFPPGLAVAGLPPCPHLTPASNHEELADKKSEGFLWGVPKRRRSVEKRLTRKFGLKEWHWKMLIPKYNLLICDTCGHHYQAKHLCRNCYEKTAAESKLIREQIELKLGHSPDKQDVVVLYDSDKSNSTSEELDAFKANYSNRLIVELPKERPSFFSQNLLQKTTSGINKKSKDITTTNPIPIVHKTSTE